MSVVKREVIESVEALNRAYVDALDRAELKNWVACFSGVPDAAYYCISAESVRRGLAVPLMCDDCRARIDDRVTFIEKVWAGTYEPYRTRHFTQLIDISHTDDQHYRSVFHFSIYVSAEGAGTEILTSGRYEDLIVVDETSALFHERRAIYDADVLPRYIVYPF
ncbi:aromatic-ring-hydroxylating dioxygenase subunit beta [Paraburkholderia fungorum]|jgi:anthranilate 1,2-dioxygenase small subunit|uniref:aromatic-ring-hydroxylating dioxygenase subunit beta n=1 Tax=Paraburkholderia fungorum TaxID=134537 RepID=UPI000DB0106E|nr:aromatic-ring-hydroxylating dioxygenase subunit beta [Paraburkholderia fungorum]PZR46751.1 MAG: aromatic-ring-hydroxylating dioxygenase subunit beta [Paraburkholderia fungorum]